MTTATLEYGDPRVRQAVWKNIHPEPNTGCWLWSGYINEDGYGRGYPVAGGRLVMAHWITFESMVRPVRYPDEELDHLCVTRACVNPAHLEAVPHRVNRDRQAKSITHCKYGHEFTPENTTRTRNGNRACLPCRRRRNSRNLGKTLD